MQGIIDRFEGSFVVIEWEGRQMQNVARELLPGCAKEGDVIELKEGRYMVDPEQTRKRQKEIQDLSKGLWQE